MTNMATCFMYEACDIPPGMTIAESRAQRCEHHERPRRLTQLTRWRSRSARTVTPLTASRA